MGECLIEMFINLLCDIFAFKRNHEKASMCASSTCFKKSEINTSSETKVFEIILRFYCVVFRVHLQNLACLMHRAADWKTHRRKSMSK